MKCQHCDKVLKDHICSEKKDGVFYFVCMECRAVHKVSINPDTFELVVELAPDEDIEIASTLLKEFMGDTRKIVVA